MSVDAVMKVEDQLQFHLPNDVLATLLSGVPALVDGWGLSLDRVDRHLSAARARGMPDRLVPVGLNPQHDRFLCLMATERARGGISQWVQWPPEGGGLGSTSDFVAARLGELRRWVNHHASEGDPDSLHRLRDHADRGGTSWWPSLSPRRSTGEAESPRRIRHEKFGLGTVKRDEGEKLVVVFDSGDEKTLLARFVEPVPDLGPG